MEPATLSRLAEISLREGGIPRELAEQALTAPPEQDLSILDQAYAVRRHHFGHGVRMHVLLNAKLGACSEDCSFCSQSARAVGDTGVGREPLSSGEQMLHAARAAEQAGAYRFCIVTATRGPSQRDLDAICPAVEQIKDELNVGVCCSLGLLGEGQAERLAGSGVDRFNHNLETSERCYEKICTTHTYDDRIETVKRARAAGMGSCCGGILGLEDDAGDVLDMAYKLRELDVESIPLNFLDPRPGTDDEKKDPPLPREALRTLAIFRLIHPHRDLRAAGGREVVLRSLQPMVLYVANSIFTEGYLTTPGNRHASDRQMIEDMGFHIERWGDRPDVPEAATADAETPAEATL